MIFIVLILVFFAGVFKAVADTLADHFEVSVFKKMNPKFWNKNESWKYAKRVFKYPVDGWHIANSMMILCFVCAVTFHDCLQQKWWAEIIYFGVINVLGFNLFYNHLLRKK